MDEAASRVRLFAQTLPKDVKRLEEEIDRLSREKEEKVRAQEFELAASLRDQEMERRREWEELRNFRAVSRSQDEEIITAEHVAEVVSEWTGVPVRRLTMDERERLLSLEEILHARVIGQASAVGAVSRAVRRGRLGLKDPKRPIGSFLFLGPTGVGKTELARALSEALFGDESNMIRVDMSEYMEKHTVSRLVGAPPGYVGYDEGGFLTEQVRRKPYSVVLFDEIEKAHPEVFHLLLQVLEDGILTDSTGRRVDFRNTVIVMTSNIGAQNIANGHRAGFSEREENDAEVAHNVMAELKRAFRPEFLNRIDETIVFHALKMEEISQIARKMTEEVCLRFEKNGVKLTVSDRAIQLLSERGYDRAYGARPLRRVIRQTVEDPAADAFLKHGACELIADVKDEEIIITKKEAEP